MAYRRKDDIHLAYIPRMQLNEELERRILLSQLRFEIIHGVLADIYYTILHDILQPDRTVIAGFKQLNKRVYEILSVGQSRLTLIITKNQFRRLISPNCTTAHGNAIDGVGRTFEYVFADFYKKVSQQGGLNGWILQDNGEVIKGKTPIQIVYNFKKEYGEELFELILDLKTYPIHCVQGRVVFDYRSGHEEYRGYAKMMAGATHFLMASSTLAKELYGIERLITIKRLRQWYVLLIRLSCDARSVDGVHKMETIKHSVLTNYFGFKRDKTKDNYQWYEDLKSEFEYLILIYNLGVGYFKLQHSIHLPIPKLCLISHDTITFSYAP